MRSGSLTEGEESQGAKVATSRLFGLDFACGAPADIIALATRGPASGPRMIVTANIDHIVNLVDNADFWHAYQDAAVRTLDGMPLVWLARLRGDRWATRITGHDLLAAALPDGQAPNLRVFMVCSSNAVAKAMTERLQARGLSADQIAFDVPPFGFERDEAYGTKLARSIREHRTTLLIMGVGAPKSEVWAHRQRAMIGSPLILNIGDALTVAAGMAPRAPAVMQRYGVEWLFRFASSPRRLFRRYFIRSWRFLHIAMAGLDVPLQKA